MPVKSGIIGLPNVGKSLLFNVLSNSKAPSENFPFCTIEPNQSIVIIPDKRLQALTSLVKSKRVHAATMKVVDIAGLVKGASEGEGLGNQFLAYIRGVDQLVHVIRCFDNPDVDHVTGGVDPVFDKSVIDEELQLKDLATLVKKKERLSKLRDEKTMLEKQLVDMYIEALNKGQNARDLSTTSHTLPIVQSWQLLTQKPVIYVANIDEASLKQGGNAYVEELRQAVKGEGAVLISLCIRLEARLAELSEQDKSQVLASYNLTCTSLDRLIQTSYDLLNLITYFTAGPEEVRAWPIHHNTLAPQAAASIHTDLEKGFIKAQVIKLEDYLHHKSEKACKQAGKVSIQGKKYIVQDGDIIHFICKT